MKPFTLTRIMRLAPNAEGTLPGGLAATWNLIEHDGFQLVRGAFSQFVKRINDGGVLPVLWQHARMLPAIGRVQSLVETDEGLRFSYMPNGSSLARDVEANIASGTATDVSVNIVAWATDPTAPHRIVRAELDEISVCTTGFAADQGAGLGRAADLQRLGTYDAAYVLETMQSLKNDMARLVALLDPNRSDWGDPVSPELDAAIRADAAGLESVIREAFAKLTPQEN